MRPPSLHPSIPPPIRPSSGGSRGRRRLAGPPSVRTPFLADAGARPSTVSPPPAIRPAAIHPSSSGGRRRRRWLAPPQRAPSISRQHRRAAVSRISSSGLCPSAHPSLLLQRTSQETPASPAPQHAPSVPPRPSPELALRRRVSTHFNRGCQLQLQPVSPRLQQHQHQLGAVLTCEFIDNKNAFKTVLEDEPEQLNT
uniref:Uncharacterized protein n=1 Tax=Oryza punctata TaxID=4537 RepID=A0A0E0MEP3_ORYPU